MNEINKTLYIPLYGKAKVSKMGIILNDKTAETIWDENAVSLGRKSKNLAEDVCDRAAGEV